MNQTLHDFLQKGWSDKNSYSHAESGNDMIWLKSLLLLLFSMKETFLNINLILYDFFISLVRNYLYGFQSNIYLCQLEIITGFLDPREILLIISSAKVESMFSFQKFLTYLQTQIDINFKGRIIESDQGSA